MKISTSTAYTPRAPTHRLFTVPSCQNSEIRIILPFRHNLAYMSNCCHETSRR